MSFEKILVSLLLFYNFSSFAQAPGQPDAKPPARAIIKGKVIDAETNQSMEYANVSIYSKKDSSLVSGGITDERGEFRVSQIDFGTYYVEANFIGFNKTRINDIRISASNREIDLGTIKLEPSSQELEEVNVVANRARISYQIDKKVINVDQDINAAGGSAVDVLENTPSVEVDIEGNVTLRGSSNFTVYIDGKPSILDGSEALRQLPASVIENIEIITNPSAKYDPDGMAGIINVVMKKNILSGFNGIVNTMVGTGDKYRGDLLINYKTKKFNVFLGADWRDETFTGEIETDRRTFSNDTTRSIIRDGDRNYQRKGYEFKGGLDLYLSDRTTMTFSGNFGYSSSARDGFNRSRNFTDPESETIYSVEEDISERESDFYSANIDFQHKFDEEGEHKLDATFYYANEKGPDEEIEKELLTDANYNKIGGSLRHNRTLETEDEDEYRVKVDYTRPIPNGKIEAGFQSRIDREYEDYLFQDADEDGNWIYNEDFSSEQYFSRDIHAVYGTFNNKLGKLQYMLGLRGEYTDRSVKHSASTDPYEINRFDYFPTLHLSYDISKQTQFMTSYSKRIDRPGGRELDPFPSYIDRFTIWVGNPGLDPQYTDSYELGLMQRFGTSSYISLEGFYKQTNNLISRVQELGDDGILYMTYENLNKDHSLGGEFMANINLTEWLLLNGSFSVFRYRIEGELDGESIDRTSTNYNGRINTTIRFSPNSRLQFTGYYRGPSVSAQGEYKSMLFSNLAYRHDFMNKKLSATLSFRDMFGSRSFESISHGQDFSSMFKMNRESQVLTLTLSYKINNYKLDNGNGGRDGGGMDMDVDF